MASFLLVAVLVDKQNKREGREMGQQRPARAEPGRVHGWAGCRRWSEKEGPFWAPRGGQSTVDRTIGGSEGGLLRFEF
jgi:hypothetical protein